MSLQSCDIHGAFVRTNPVQPMLLRDLSQNGRRRRLRYQSGSGFDTLHVNGRENIKMYRAKIAEEGTGKLIESKNERSFCMICGSACGFGARNGLNIYIHMPQLSIPTFLNQLKNGI